MATPAKQKTLTITMKPGAQCAGPFGVLYPGQTYTLPEAKANQLVNAGRATLAGGGGGVSKPVTAPADLRGPKGEPIETEPASQERIKEVHQREAKGKQKAAGQPEQQAVKA